MFSCYSKSFRAWKRRKYCKFYIRGCGMKGTSNQPAFLGYLHYSSSKVSCLRTESVAPNNWAQAYRNHNGYACPRVLPAGSSETILRSTSSSWIVLLQLAVTRPIDAARYVSLHRISRPLLDDPRSATLHSCRYQILLQIRISAQSCINRKVFSLLPHNQFIRIDGCNTCGSLAGNT